MKGFFDWRRALNPRVKGRTVVSEFKVLQGLFRPAERDGLISKNPMKSLMSERLKYCFQIRTNFNIRI